MKFYVKLIMEGEFPSGRDTELFEVLEETYDKVWDIVDREGKNLWEVKK